MARFPGSGSRAWRRSSIKSPFISARSPHKESAVLGPFMVGEYKPGAYVLLRRNPNYWKRDANGKRLPYLDSIRLDIQQNRELELLRFRRGELDIVNKLDPEMYDRLSAEMPHSVVDAGPSLDWEMVFFNQVANAPLPEYKRRWFRSDGFRRAISDAIHRDDLAAIVYRGHARPAAGPVSASNHFWLNARLKPPAYSTGGSLERLAARWLPPLGRRPARSRRPQSRILDDHQRRKQAARAHAGADPAGSRASSAFSSMSCVLDFPSLIERISRSFNYESVLMAFTNVGSGSRAIR